MASHSDHSLENDEDLSSLHKYDIFTIWIEDLITT